MLLDFLRVLFAVDFRARADALPALHAAADRSVAEDLRARALPPLRPAAARTADFREVLLRVPVALRAVVLRPVVLRVDLRAVDFFRVPVALRAVVLRPVVLRVDLRAVDFF
ncbi:MAG: hypothetical protein M3P18_11595, partial [Actinomycetota bacterium]|nr:hypothetical protein [Actinomycetota bacterium]